MLTFLPAIVSALASAHAPVDAPVHALQTRAQGAGGQLAGVLSDADMIDWVAANDSTITFGIERRDVALRVTVTTRANGEVASLAIVPMDGVPHQAGTVGVLSWLGGELRDAAAIDRLDVDDDGAIVIETSDGRRYLAIPSREASGKRNGNAGVEARWAAAWDSEAPAS